MARGKSASKKSNKKTAIKSVAKSVGKAKQGRKKKNEVPVESLNEVVPARSLEAIKIQRLEEMKKAG